MCIMVKRQLLLLLQRILLVHRMHGWLNNGEASTAFAPAENFTCAPNAWVVK